MTDMKLKMAQELSERIKKLRELLSGTAILKIHGLGMAEGDYFQVDDFSSIDAEAIKNISQALNELLSRLLLEYEKM